MEVLFGLIPLMLFFGFLVVVVFIWMAKTGHFDDLDGAAHSIFMDDEYDDDYPSPVKKDSEKDVVINSEFAPEEVTVESKKE